MKEVKAVSEKGHMCMDATASKAAHICDTVDTGSMLPSVHALEQTLPYLQVVWQLSSSSIPWVHRD